MPSTCHLLSLTSRHHTAVVTLHYLLYTEQEEEL